MAIGFGVRAGAQSEPGSTLKRVVDLMTDQDTMTLDRQSVLARIAFRGGEPVVQQSGNVAIYDVRDATELFAHVEFRKQVDRWRLVTLTLLFDTEDKISLAALRAAFTRRFGDPKDITASPQSNTVLLWRGTDRLVRVVADVPGDPAMLVYAVTLSTP